VPDEDAAKNLLRDPSAPLFDLKLTPNTGGAPEDMLLKAKPVAAYSTDAKFYFSCFETPMSLGLLTETYEVAEDALPQKPLTPMACFNAEQLAQDIASGDALSLVGQRNIIDGYDRIIAVYSDGRAFAWHQKAQ